MKYSVLGMVSFCIGLGMLLAILVPAFGWAFFVAIALLGAGYHMTKGC